MNLLVMVIAARVHAYEPPGGIPDPSWGDLHPVQSAAPGWPGSWPASEEPGYYYVDSGAPAATDRNNKYGHPARPRATIPETNYAPGSYVEIHGGPYNGGGQIIFTANGTEQAPVWIRGPESDAKAVIRGEMLVKGSYVFIENLRFDSNRTLGLRPHNRSTLNHVVVRDCHFAGPGTNAGNQSAIAISGLPGEYRYSDIVIYNNQIHDFGDRLSATENDFHGIKVAVNVDRLWILDNVIYNVSGDSVQVGMASMPDDKRASHIYIGRNSFYGNRENAVDIKNSRDVIVSQNSMYDFQPTNTSEGAAVVIHNNPKNIWVLGNTIFDSGHGVVNTGGENVWVMSNVFYDIHHNQNGWNPDRLYAGGSAVHFRGASSGGIINNTFHDYDIGLQLAQGGRGYSVINNVFSHRSQSNGYDIIAKDKAVIANSTLDYLAFKQPSTERVLWGERSFTAKELRKGSTAVCENCFSTDRQLFIDADDRDFTPTPDSPVIDAGRATDDLYEFDSLYDHSTLTDANGNPRHQGTSVDIGAIEASR
jgi:hypothetical protein